LPDTKSSAEAATCMKALELQAAAN